MSGAEALVAVGLASNVLQFIDFGTKLYARIREYSSAAGGAPKKVKDLEERLSLVLTTLNGLSQDGRATVEQEQTTIQLCLSRAHELGLLLEGFKVKAVPNKDAKDGSTWIERRLANVEKTWKAFKSLHGEEKVEEFQKVLDRLIALIQLQLKARTVCVDDPLLYHVRRITSD